MQNEQFYQVEKYDLHLLKKGDVIHTNVFDNTMQSVVLLERFKILGDGQCTAGVLYKGIDVILEFNANYSVPIWTASLVSGWRTK